MSEKKRKTASKRLKLFPRLLLFIVCCLAASALMTSIFYFFVTVVLKLTLPHLVFVYFLTLAACVGVASALLSRALGSLWEQSEKEIDRILKEIANGNFDVQINLTKNERVNQSINNINKVLQELKSVKILRNDFISNFSHEFKTPLVNINGFAELLLSDDLTEKERKEYAQIIYDESNRLASLSSNTLLMNKLSAQKIVQNKRPYALDEQIRQCVAQFYCELNAKNLQIECEAEPIVFCGDEGLLQRVWINLLSNAVKFSNEGGKLTVILVKEGKNAAVSVADEGCGMTEETTAHIFDEFYQGDTSHKTDGNGLGLSIVKRIVELCDGTVTVTSTPGKGSVFTVRLPLSSDSRAI